jgi:hypothetical protein
MTGKHHSPSPQEFRPYRPCATPSAKSFTLLAFSVTVRMPFSVDSKVSNTSGQDAALPKSKVGVEPTR